MGTMGIDDRKNNNPYQRGSWQVEDISDYFNQRMNHKNDKTKIENAKNDNLAPFTNSEDGSLVVNIDYLINEIRKITKTQKIIPRKGRICAAIKIDLNKSSLFQVAYINHLNLDKRQSQLILNYKNEFESLKFDSNSIDDLIDKVDSFIEEKLPAQREIPTSIKHTIEAKIRARAVSYYAINYSNLKSNYQK